MNTNKHGDEPVVANRRYIYQGGRRTRRRGHPAKRVNEASFDEITAESAYWIGMIAADGCIHGNKREEMSRAQRSISMTLKIDDIEHLEKLKAFLKSESDIRRFERHSDRHSQKAIARIVVTSDRLANALERYGVTEAKSLTIKIIGLENNRDFWRGYIDGNGTVSWSGGKWPSPQIILCSGSWEIGRQFAVFVASNDGYDPPPIAPKKNGEGCRVTVTGKRASFLAKMLYENCAVALDRKHAEAVKLIAYSPDPRFSTKIYPNPSRLTA